MSMFKVVWLYLSSSEYSLTDLLNILRGSNELPAQLWAEVMHVNLIQEANEFQLPIYFFAGKYDYNTLSILTQKYYDKLSAPRKAFVWFPESSHLLNVTASEQYQQEIINRVLDKP